jgi:hypothetical protein
VKSHSFTAAARSWRLTGSAGTALLTASCALALDAGCVETPCGPRLSCDPPAEAADDDPPPVHVPLCPAEPKAGVVPEDWCGVFASSSLGDDSNRGTRDAPVKTIAKAIELADEETHRVHACFETFSEAVRVRGSLGVRRNLEIWGGFDCMTGWRHSGGQRNTVIEAEPDEVPLTFESNSTCTVFDVEATAALATAPGGSSIAAVALEGAVVHIHRGKLIAANGARGRDGALGHPMNEPATAGNHGLFGQDACTEDFVPGADQVQTVCEEQGSTSGRGPRDRRRVLHPRAAHR